MSKPTPGPWAALPFKVTANTASGFRGGWHINQVGGPGFVCSLDKREHVAGECEANARLIASAPDLLEALTAFVDFPADTFEGDEDGAFTMTVRLNDLRAARAAILKAAGEGA